MGTDPNLKDDLGLPPPPVADEPPEGLRQEEVRREGEHGDEAAGHVHRRPVAVEVDEGGQGEVGDVGDEVVEGHGMAAVALGEVLDLQRERESG